MFICVDGKTATCACCRLAHRAMCYCRSPCVCGHVDPVTCLFLCAVIVVGCGGSLCPMWLFSAITVSKWDRLEVGSDEGKNDGARAEEDIDGV